MHRFNPRNESTRAGPGVFFFGCNMDPSGTRDFEPTPIVDRCFRRHAKDYVDLSATPDQFNVFVEAVGQMMKSEPNYSAGDLTHIHVPVAIVQSEYDEFIKPEHAEYLARSIPAAELIILSGVSHFAPLQRPEQFNGVMRAFLGKVLSKREDDSRRRLAEVRFGSRLAVGLLRRRGREGSSAE